MMRTFYAASAAPPECRLDDSMENDHDADKTTTGRRARQHAIGAELRRRFQAVAEEDTPERLKKLAERLDQALAESARRRDGGT